MPTPAYSAANLQWLGAAPETTYGTPVALPTYFIPADTPVWTHPTVKLVDQALIGTMAGDISQVNGMRYDQVNFKTHAYLGSIFFLIRAALGYPDQKTGASAPYTHKTSLRNDSGGQPQSTTIFWADGAGKAMQMPGAQVSDLKLTIKSDGFVDVDVTFVGLPATSITAPSNTPTTDIAVPAWNSTITVGGVAFTKFSEIDIDIKRASEAIPAITGTQSPFAIFAGEVNVSGTLTGVYESSTDNILVAELANTQPVITVKFAPAGDTVNSLTLQMSKVALDSADPTGTSKWMEIKANYKAIANATDVAAGGNVSPILATLLSPVSTVI